MKSETTNETSVLADAATRARDAVAVGRQMQAMLREYTQLEARHAARLQALAQRMGDCVDHMRTQSAHHDDEQAEEELCARQGQCVAVMDEVVTFLTRFASMHRHLSDCLASDLFDEWSEALAVQETRVDTRTPELDGAQRELQEAERAYQQAHSAFQADFDNACALYASASKRAGDMSDERLGQDVRAELASLAANSEVHNLRTPSKAMQYMGSIARRFRVSSATNGDYDPHSGDSAREVATAILKAELERQGCQCAYQTMNKLSVRYKRLCDSLLQEYRCIQSECLASTRTSIRKLVIHVSAFTSNLQYDATQLFQQVEALHANEASDSNGQHAPFPAVLSATSSSTCPSPPQDVPLTLEHVIRRRFPVMNERPKLLRHQNACHILAV